MLKYHLRLDLGTEVIELSFSWCLSPYVLTIELFPELVLIPELPNDSLDSCNHALLLIRIYVSGYAVEHFMVPGCSHNVLVSQILLCFFSDFGVSLSVH